MFRKVSFWLIAGTITFLQSCSLNSETTYYKDSATSNQTNILMDPAMLGMMNLMTNTDLEKNKNLDLSTVSTDWKNLYDIQKTGKIVLNDKDAGALKKMFLKVNKRGNDITGISIKYDKILPKELAALLTDTKYLNKIPMQDFAVWNGKSLTIDTEKFNIAEALNGLESIKPDENTKTPKTKSDSIENYGRQMAQGMMGMMKMFNMSFSNTLKFQKPIKSIEGKHDFVKKIDSKTIEINVNTKELWDNASLRNKDKKIVITTE